MPTIEMENQVTVDLTDTQWLDNDNVPTTPRLRLHLSMPEEVLADRFRNPAGSAYRPEDLDVYFRECSSTRATVSTGVLTVSDRLTGDLLIEGTISSTVIERLVYAVHQRADRASDPPTYVVELVVHGDDVAAFEKQALLVYDSDGNLLRERSVIPTHIEL